MATKQIIVSLQAKHLELLDSLSPNTSTAMIMLIESKYAVEKVQLHHVEKAFCIALKITGYTKDELKSISRTGPVTIVRNTLIKYFRDLGMTTTKIGSIMNRDHSTVINSINSVKLDFKLNRELRK